MLNYKEIIKDTLGLLSIIAICVGVMVLGAIL